MKKNNYWNFSSLEKIAIDNESSSLISSVCEEIVAHLKMLSKSFDMCFDVGKMETSKERMMNSHSFNLHKMSDDRNCGQFIGGISREA